MKKYLFGTSALVAAALVAGTASAAEPLKLGISGNMQQWFGVVNQSGYGPNAAGQPNKAGRREFSHTGINTDTEIDFKASTKLDNGLEVTAVINLDTWNNVGGGGNTGTQGGTVTVKEEWAAVAGGWGTVVAGVTPSANMLLHNEAVDYGIGYGDVDLWIKKPQSFVTYNAGNTAANTVGRNDYLYTSFRNFGVVGAVAYVSPQFYGFQGAVSYSPHGAALGIQNTNANATAAASGTTSPQVNDYVDVTLAYKGEIAGVSIGADGGLARTQYGSVSYSGGNNVAYNDLRGGTMQAWNAGLKLGYAGFTLGGAYFRRMEDSKSQGTIAAGVPSLTNALDGSAWNVGLAYANGPWGVSGLYFRTSTQGDIVNYSTARDGGEHFDTWLVSGKYNLGPGIDLKTSAFYANYWGNLQIDNTTGYGLVSGIDLTF